ncbi:pilus assembly protein CpaE [Lampropedia puyangensis]|uniref:Pilus assembly protein CpaE n=2 Tax=Lampropedia puyangensis TaxID=1330072 RepID=A0A4S8F477_9BURK|nr:pilus assembly protein CpaE [Lampropedia puyangensis]
MRFEKNAAPQADTPAGAPNPLAPATLEALLSMRPAAASAPERQEKTAGTTPEVPPQRSALEVLHAQTVKPTACADLDAELLFIHAGTSESTLATTWMRRVFDGARLHHARYQENIKEQILLLTPHVVFIHFDAPVLDLATHLVEQIRTSHPHLPLVAVGRMRNPQCTLAALRAGVQDFLDLDGTSQAAQEAVRELILRTPATVADTGQFAPLTALISARAGTGCSLLASHLALYLQQRLRQHSSAQAVPHSEATETPLDTLLIDLGHPANDCAMYLNCPGDFDFVEAVRNLRRFDRKLTAAALARHAQGLRILALPKGDSSPDIAHSDTDLILLRLRQYFRHVIADLGAVRQSSLAERVALRASQIWIVCEQSVPSVVSTAALLEQLAAQKVDRSNIQLIVNRHDARLELSAEQIAAQLHLPLLATIADRRMVLAQAVNQGQMLDGTLHREPYVQAIDKLTDQLTSQHQLAPVHKAPRGLSRFFQRNPSA